MSTKLVLASGLCCLLWAGCCLAAQPDSKKKPYSAEALRKTLDKFYKQHIVADGLVVAGSEKVSLHALREVDTWRRRCLPTGPT